MKTVLQSFKSKIMNLLSFIPASMISIFALVGTYCFILAYDRQHYIQRVLQKGIETEGTVIEIRRNPGSLFSKVDGEGEAPVVDFTFANGTHRHYSTTYTTPCPYKIGQKVRICYLFYKSKREVALSDEETGNSPKILFTWGIVLCLLSYPEIIRRVLFLVG
jgi:hypothetical protein